MNIKDNDFLPLSYIQQVFLNFINFLLVFLFFFFWLQLSGSFYFMVSVLDTMLRHAIAHWWIILLIRKHFDFLNWNLMPSSIHPIVHVLTWDMEREDHHQDGVDLMRDFWHMGILPESWKRLSWINKIRVHFESPF